MVFDRKNLSALPEEMDRLDRFLQFLILGGKIYPHDMFLHAAGAVPVWIEKHAFLVQEAIQFFSTPGYFFSHRAFLLPQNHGDFFVG